MQLAGAFYTRGLASNGKGEILERSDWESRLSGGERLRQCERTASRVIDGKAVVITIDRNELHVLNAVGTRVWELADGRPLSAIVDEIVREFAVERERAALDVCTFAEQLLSVGAARIARTADGA